MRFIQQGSWRFILLCVIVIGGAFFSWKAYSQYKLSGYKMAHISPGKVSLIAVQPDKGYRVIVANRIAQIAEVSGGDDGRGGFGGGAIENATNAKRLPIREMLRSLQGDEKALGTLIEKMNDLGTGDDPFSTYVWKAEDIKKALAGDKEIAARLESDIQVRLDGSPLDSVNVSKVVSGIAIDSPIKVRLPVNGVETDLIARVKQPYQSALANQLASKINSRFSVTPEFVAGTFTDMATEILSGKRPKEQVRTALESRISDSNLADLAKRPIRVLSLAETIINDSFISHAEIETYRGQDNKELSDLIINLTEEGRMRLWKYSSEHTKFQLLLVVDGVAVAAPRITTELAESSIRITQLPDNGIAEDAMNQMNRLAKERR